MPELDSPTVDIARNSDGVIEIALQKSLGESTMGKCSTPYRLKFSFYEVFRKRLQYSGFSAYVHVNLEKVKGSQMSILISPRR